MTIAGRRIALLVIKELTSFFMSHLTYVLGALFSLFIGWLFFNYSLNISGQPDPNILQSIVHPLFGNMNLLFLFLVPMITMKAFAEEERLGTLDFLMITPLNAFEIVLAKYFSCLGVVCFFIGTTFVLPLMLYWAGFEEWNILLANYIGLIFMTGFYVSIGLFASSLTNNLFVATVLSWLILFSIFLMLLAANGVTNPLLAQVFQYLSMAYHFQGFAMGVIKSYNVIYYTSATGFFLYLCHQSLKLRFW